MTMLPPPPAAASNTVAVSAPAATDKQAISKIKQFAAGFIGEGEQRTKVAAPTPAGVNMTEFVSSVVDFVKTKLGDNYAAFVEACDRLEKTATPGHKEGKCAYFGARHLVGLHEIVNSVNKKRTPRGSTVAAKDAEIVALKAQIAELMAKMGK